MAPIMQFFIGIIKKTIILERFLEGIILQNRILQKNLKRLRTMAKLSQRELSSKMNLLGSKIDRNTYSMIELGTRNIKVTDLVALQQIYGVDFAEFFKGIGPRG